MGLNNILGATVGAMETAEIINVAIILVIFFIFWFILRAMKRKGFAVGHSVKSHKKKSKK
jgi:hypothetical protein